MLENELIYCYECGCEIDECSEYHDPGGKLICEDCFHESYMYCDECGEVIRQDDAVSVNSGDFYVCERCADNHYYKCDSCGDYFTSGDIYVRNINLCDSCTENYYVCDDCGDFVHQDDVYFIDGGAYCDSCAPEYSNSNLIRDAYYKPDPRFLGGYANGYYGIELEIDNGHSRMDCAAAITAAAGDDIYLKYDGSLNNGFEIVTHPATLYYHLNNMNWEGICSAALDYDFRSHDTNTCGLHIHASRTLFGNNTLMQELNIAKIILLIENNFDSIILPFSRRASDRMREWSHRPRASINDYDNEQTAIDKAKRTEDNGRYQAVNLTNRNTIEFRFFRGSLAPSTIKAAIIFIDFMIDYVKNNNLKDVALKDFRSELEENSTGIFRDYLIKRNIIKNNESEEIKECV